MKQVFLAIRLAHSPIIKSYYTEYQSQFGFAKLRWVEPKFLHITLKYFGSKSDSDIKKVIYALDAVLKSVKSFQINVSKLRVFGSSYARSVLWWGIKEEEYVKDIAAEIQFKLDKIGMLADNQNFVPHISLARIITLNSKPFFQKQLKRLAVPKGISQIIESFVLLETKISAHGPEYIELHRFHLKSPMINNS